MRDRIPHATARRKNGGNRKDDRSPVLLLFFFFHSEEAASPRMYAADGLMIALAVVPRIIRDSIARDIKIPTRLV